MLSETPFSVQFQVGANVNVIWMIYLSFMISCVYVLYMRELFGFDNMLNIDFY